MTVFHFGTVEAGPRKLRRGVSLVQDTQSGGHVTRKRRQVQALKTETEHIVVRTELAQTHSFFSSCAHVDTSPTHTRQLKDMWIILIHALPKRHLISSMFHGTLFNAQWSSRFSSSLHFSGTDIQSDKHSISAESFNESNGCRFARRSLL